MRSDTSVNDLWRKARELAQRSRLDCSDREVTLHYSVDCLAAARRSLYDIVVTSWGDHRTVDFDESSLPWQDLGVGDVERAFWEAGVRDARRAMERAKRLSHEPARLHGLLQAREALISGIETGARCVRGKPLYDMRNVDEAAVAWHTAGLKCFVDVIRPLALNKMRDHMHHYAVDTEAQSRYYLECCDLARAACYDLNDADVIEYFRLEAGFTFSAAQQLKYALHDFLECARGQRYPEDYVGILMEAGLPKRICMDFAAAVRMRNAIHTQDLWFCANGQDILPAHEKWIKALPLFRLDHYTFEITKMPLECCLT